MGDRVGATPISNEDAGAAESASIGEPRLALLVGNDSYAQAALRNPVNDVRLIGKTLEALGFEVTRLENVDKATFHSAVIDFSARLEAAGSEAVAFFAFAGHGIQNDGTNYLLPVKADIPTSRHLAAGAMKLDDIVEELTRTPRKANVVVLDACRNNPLPKMRAVSRDVTRGLATLRMPDDGMMVAYSTAAGAVAEDGDERNSPYTLALVEALPGLLQPDRRIHDVFVEAAVRVREATEGRQNPALYLAGALPALVVTETDRARLKTIATGDETALRPARWRHLLRPVRSGAWRKVTTVTAVAGAVALGAVIAPRFMPTHTAEPGRAVESSGRSPAPGADKLAWYMSDEFAASLTPWGYRFRNIEPYCCIEDNEKRLGITGYARVAFLRDDLASGGSQDLWEGFNLTTFKDAGPAARFTMSDDEALSLMKMMLGTDEAIARHFNERAPRSHLTVTASASSAGSVQLRCFAADTLIGCFSRSTSNPRVVVQLLVQEPRLREARSDATRQGLVKERLQKSSGLLEAANKHVAWADGMAKR